MDEQDLRRMGGLVKFLPCTYVCILFGSLAIVGFPFLTGFYSKDVILELAVSRYMLDGYFVYFLAILAAFFTSIYSTRLIILIFFGNINVMCVSHIAECNIQCFFQYFFCAFFQYFLVIYFLIFSSFR